MKSGKNTASTLTARGLEFFDVQEIPTHGGSLRVFSKHIEDKSKQISTSVELLLSKEKSLGVDTLAYYQGFQQKTEKIKDDLITFLIRAKNEEIRKERETAADVIATKFACFKRDFMSAPIR